MSSRIRIALAESRRPVEDAAEMIEAMREAILTSVCNGPRDLVAAPLVRARNLVSRPMIGDILGELVAEILGISTGEFAAMADRGRIQGGPMQREGRGERSGGGGKRALERRGPHSSKRRE